MRIMKLPAIATMFVLWLFLSVPAFAGPKIDFGEDSYMKFGILGQPHFSYMSDAAEEHDFYLRRLRLIMDGQIMKGVKVFVETDYANAGRYGVDAKMDIQDAFVDVQLFNTDQWVEGGLILLPFSFENASSAASLLGNDYNSECIKFVNSFVWRDNGVNFHGSFAKRVAYRVGIFDGYDNDNKYEDARLRFTGRVDFAVLGEVPTGWFYSQDPITDQTYLNVGAGIDHQDKATIDNNGVVHDSSAWVVDFQSGYKLTDILHLTVNGAWYDWDNSNFNGSTAFVEGGLRYSKFMPTLKYTMQNPDSGSTLNDYTIGLQYYFKGHNLRAGIEYRWGDSSNWWLVGTQFLL